MFSLKAPSLLNFKKQSDPEANNLRSLYRLTGDLPCDSQMRATLDALPPRHLRSLFRPLFLQLKEAGVLRDYSYDKKAVIATKVRLMFRSTSSSTKKPVVMAKSRLGLG